MGVGVSAGGLAGHVARLGGVVVGAGLPRDLPDLAAEHPQVALIPILSDARGVQLVVREWEKKGRLPDAIVIEHPRLAGGHLGAAKVSDLQVLAFFKTAGLERDAETSFKQVLARARPEDLVEFVRVAGLPARAVRTPCLEKYLRVEPKLKAVAHVKKKCNMSFDYLAHCGLRDGKTEMGQFCIDQQLGHALDGDTERGLFFRGAGNLPFGREIRPVHDLMLHLLGEAA